MRSTRIFFLFCILNSCCRRWSSFVFIRAHAICWVAGLTVRYMKDWTPTPTSCLTTAIMTFSKHWVWLLIICLSHYRVSGVPQLRLRDPRVLLQYPKLEGHPSPDDETVVGRDEESCLRPGGSVVGLTGVESHYEDRHSQGKEGRQWRWQEKFIAVAC